LTYLAHKGALLLWTIRGCPDSGRFGAVLNQLVKAGRRKSKLLLDRVYALTNLLLQWQVQKRLSHKKALKSSAFFLSPTDKA